MCTQAQTPLTATAIATTWAGFLTALTISAKDLHRIVDFDRWDDPRRSGRGEWRLWVRYPNGEVRGPTTFRSHEFRHPARLSRRLFWFGRNPELDPITSVDGRRALAVMHTYIEMKETES